MPIYNVSSIVLIDLLKNGNLDEFSCLTGILYSNYDLIIANSIVGEIEYYVVYETKLYRSHDFRVNLVVPRTFFESWKKVSYPLIYVRVESNIENQLHLKIQESLASPRRKFKSDTWKFRKVGSKLTLKYLGLCCKIREYYPTDRLYTDFKRVKN